MIASIPELIYEIKIGHPVVMLDNENRENEGDLIIASEFATPRWINFMAKYACGLICTAITYQRAVHLDLQPMVTKNTDPNCTAFTISVDAKTNSTGISAFDRADTISKLINQKSKPEDLRRPGHMFPLICKSGGVLSRPGHTEAGVDLARLAGLYPSAVICEIMDEDGHMKRLPHLIKYCYKFQFKLGTIVSLIEYLVKNKLSIKQTEF